MRHPLSCLGVLGLCVAVSSVHAQTAAPPPAKLHFDAATIKPAGPTERGWDLRRTPHGYHGMNVSLHYLIQEAYGIYDDQLLFGMPRWADDAKFDLEAAFDPGEVNHGQPLTDCHRAEMLQPLLEERFHLKAHYETRTVPVLALVVKKRGAKLQPPSAEESKHEYCLHTTKGMENCAVADLANDLRYSTGHTVVDRTGISGHYTFDLMWDGTQGLTPDQRAAAPSIYTALEEQLGLRLEPSTAPLQVLVIDSVERQPTEN